MVHRYTITIFIPKYHMGYQFSPKTAILMYHLNTSELAFMVHRYAINISIPYYQMEYQFFLSYGILVFGHQLACQDGH